MVTWSDPGYEAVIRVVRERAGLVFSPGRRTAVENTIHRAMLRVGANDTALFAERVRADAALRNALISELTVGESYFFRDPSQFTLIEHEIVPDLLARRAPHVPLRVWSAGCASGEEPYSLAILFERMGLAGRARITATEIAEPRLEAARRARYGRWALRGVRPELVDACFEHNGRYYDLAPELRATVDFRRLNLVEDAYPAPDQGLADLDLILCRNVLIYFDMETVRTVAAGLLASLAEDGWLLLSAADPPIAELVPCAVLLTPHGIAYRRIEQAPTDGVDERGWRVVQGTAWRGPEPGTSGRAPESAWESEPASAAQETASDSAALSHPSPTAHPATLTDDPGVVPPTLAGAVDADVLAAAPDLPDPAITEEPSTATNWANRIRALADQGRLEEAGRLCAAALDRDRLCAELIVLHAVLLTEAARPREAAAAARQALYLDRELVMAHILRGQALARLGERAAAVHAFENARRLLERLDAEAPVPASDGQPAGALLDRVMSHLRLLREAG